MLRLEAETGTLRVILAVLSLDRAIEKIARIELQTGLGSENFHSAARSGLKNSRRK